MVNKGHTKKHGTEETIENVTISEVKHNLKKSLYFFPGLSNSNYSTLQNTNFGQLHQKLLPK